MSFVRQLKSRNLDYLREFIASSTCGVVQHKATYCHNISSCESSALATLETWTGYSDHLNKKGCKISMFLSYSHSIRILYAWCFWTKILAHKNFWKEDSHGNIFVAREKPMLSEFQDCEMIYFPSTQDVKPRNRIFPFLNHVSEKPQIIMPRYSAVVAILFNTWRLLLNDTTGLRLESWLSYFKTPSFCSYMISVYDLSVWTTRSLTVNCNHVATIGH